MVRCKVPDGIWTPPNCAAPSCLFEISHHRKVFLFEIFAETSTIRIIVDQTRSADFCMILHLVVQSIRMRHSTASSEGVWMAKRRIITGSCNWVCMYSRSLRVVVRCHAFSCISRLGRLASRRMSSRRPQRKVLENATSTYGEASLWWGARL